MDSKFNYLIMVAFKWLIINKQYDFIIIYNKTFNKISLVNAEPTLY